MKTLIGFMLFISALEAKVERFANLAESIRRKNVDGQFLFLNGIATHRRFIFDIYRVSLYVPNPTQDANLLISTDELKFAEMQFLRDISAKTLQDAFLDTFQENCLNDCEKLKPDIDRLISIIPDMKDGEIVDFTFRPTECVIRGFNEQSISFAGSEFGRFFMRAWLGDSPPSSRFRRELLNI